MAESTGSGNSSQPSGLASAVAEGGGNYLQQLFWNQQAGLYPSDYSWVAQPDGSVTAVPNLILYAKVAGTPAAAPTPGTPSGGYTNVTWAQKVLSDLGVSTTGNNLTFMLNWMASEEPTNDWWNRDNPLNNGLGSGGGSGLGSYPDLTTAASYAAQNLSAGNYGYGAIVSDLQANADPGATAQALWNSSWASGHYGYGANWSTSAGGLPAVMAPAGTGDAMANMTTADWQALNNAGQVPGGQAYLTALYEQQQNAAATGTGGQPTASTSATGGNAQAIINAALAELGPSFNTPQMQAWAQQELTGLAAKGMDTSTIGQQIAIDVQNTPQFEQAYPGIIALRNKGLPPMSVADYQTYSTTVEQAAADAGLPAGFMTKTEIGNLVANQISASEVTQRIKGGYEAAAFANPQTIQELATYFPQIFPAGLPTGPSNAGGLSGGTGPTTSGQVTYVDASGKTQTLSGGAAGALAAYYLDPGRAMDVLTNQLTQAQIGSEGVMTGFGQISAAQAANLQQAGITEAQARTDFGKVNKLTPFETALPGVPGGTMTQQQLIDYGFFGADQQALENVTATRKAPFSGGGGYAQTARGTVGAGYASTQGVQGT